MSQSGKPRAAGAATAAQRVDKDSKAQSAAIVAPSRRIDLYLHDLQAYGDAGAPVAAAHIAKLSVDGQTIFDSELNATLLHGGIKEAAPPTEAEMKLISEYEEKLKPYTADKARYDADLAAWEATNSAYAAQQAAIKAAAKAKTTPPAATAPKPGAKPVAPKPPPQTKATTAAYLSKQNWDTFLLQVKAALDVDVNGPTNSLYDQRLKKVLSVSGWKEETFSLEDKAARQHLAAFLNKTAIAYSKIKSDDSGKLTLPLPYAPPGATTKIKLELAGLKFSQPVEKLSELGLDLGYARRSAIFHPDRRDNDWFLGRKPESAWTIRDAQGVEKPLYNEREFSHKWDKDYQDEPAATRHVLVLNWCQPAWYRRLPRHGSAPIAPLPEATNSDRSAGRPTISPPVLDGVPTMLISTSDTMPHGRWYGRFGRQGRRMACKLRKTLRTWKEFYVYDIPEPVTPRAPREQPPDPPGQPSVRTFRKGPQLPAPPAPPTPAGEKPLPPPRAPSPWVQINPPGEAPQHALDDLDTRADPEGTELTLQVYETGTTSLERALKKLYRDGGGDPVLKKVDGCNEDHDEYRRMVVTQINEHGEITGYRAVEYRDGEGNLQADPKYDPPHKTEAEAAEIAGYRWHKGVDVANTTGEPMFALHGGTVQHRESDQAGGVVKLTRSGGGSNEYLHSQLDPTLWPQAMGRSTAKIKGKSRPGAPVKAGDVIGLTGRTGKQHATTSATHAHMQGAGITNDAGSFPESHVRLLPHNDLVEELICQTEFGRGPLNAPAHDTKDVNLCYGRTLAVDAPLPSKPYGAKAGHYTFPNGTGCWVFNDRRCPRQAEVEAERDRRIAADLEAKRKAAAEKVRLEEERRRIAAEKKAASKKVGAK